MKFLHTNKVNYGTYDFHYERKPSHATTKLTLCCQKDEWDTKENTGTSMKNALYILWYAKKALLKLKQH